MPLDLLQDLAFHPSRGALRQTSSGIAAARASAIGGEPASIVARRMSTRRSGAGKTSQRWPDLDSKDGSHSERLAYSSGSLTSSISAETGFDLRTSSSPTHPRPVRGDLDPIAAAR